MFKPFLLIVQVKNYLHSPSEEFLHYGNYWNGITSKMYI